MENKIILSSDDYAASLQTLTLWVSRHGRVYNNEQTARYDGCTHRKCDCGNLVEKHWLKCDECRAKTGVEKYRAMPFKEWDGKTPLCLFDTDTYFFSSDDIDYYCEENEIAEESSTRLKNQ